jgi:hypothetical protein
LGWNVTKKIFRKKFEKKFLKFFFLQRVPPCGQKKFSEKESKHFFLLKIFFFDDSLYFHSGLHRASRVNKLSKKTKKICARRGSR